MDNNQSSKVNTLKKEGIHYPKGYTVQIFDPKKNEITDFSKIEKNGSTASKNTSSKNNSSTTKVLTQEHSKTKVATQKSTKPLQGANSYTKPTAFLDISWLKQGEDIPLDELLENIEEKATNIMSAVEKLKLMINS